MAKIASHKIISLGTFNLYARLFCDMKFNSQQNECPQFHSLIFFTPGSDPYHLCCCSKNSTCCTMMFLFENTDTDEVGTHLIALN